MDESHMNTPEPPDTPEPSDHANSRGLGKGGVPPPKEFQWKKGQSGNPGGRPKGLTARLRELLADDVSTKRGTMKRSDVFLLAGIMRAIARSDAIWKEILARMDGPIEATKQSDMAELVREAEEREQQFDQQAGVDGDGREANPPPAAQSQ
jgi:hypothetical protein